MLRATRTFSHAPPRYLPRLASCFTTRLTTLAAESRSNKSPEPSKQKLNQTTVKENKEILDKVEPKGKDIYVIVNV